MSENLEKTAIRFESSLKDEIQCMMNEANATSTADFVRQATVFYAEWNNINWQKLSVYYYKHYPDIPLENNKELQSIKNAIIKAVAELDNIDQTQTANPKVTEMVTLWTKLFGSLINNSYQKKQAKLNNQIDSKQKAKIVKKKSSLGIKTDHTVKDVKNDEQDFMF